MILQEEIQRLANKYQTSEFPNVIREYFQHLFLSELYKIEKAGNLLFKGGTALRIVYQSPRFSEDLDFSLFQIPNFERKEYIEDLFSQVLVAIERTSVKVEMGKKSNATSGGYYGDAELKIYEYPPIGIAINISSRNGREIHGEIDTVANDFVAAYNLLHLPKEDLIEEKVFGALAERKKARDFYDLYFIMRRNMLSLDQKRRLSEIKDQIIDSAGKVDFETELGVFLPANHQMIIKNFKQTLIAEMNRQFADIIM